MKFYRQIDSQKTEAIMKRGYNSQLLQQLVLDEEN